MPGERLTDAQVEAFARLALKGIRQEYPNKPSNVMVGKESVQSPREMHPAFFGCFDWHSSVHGHWMLLRLVRLYPDAPVAKEIEACLAESFTPEKMAAEAAYFRRKHNRPFERTYGWAWALKLAEELRTWDDPRGRKWAAAFRPLEDELVGLMKGYLPRLSWPIRTGVHPDSGFALALTLDYARAVGEHELAEAVAKRAREFYGADRDYPTRYEPSGEDFFSSGLNEADLMRRVLEPEAFVGWFEGFFPGLEDGELGHLLEPAVVSDVTDGRLVHLAGLNLSRAWTLRGIAGALAEDDPRRAVLEAAVERHAKAGLGYVFSGHYEGEHWLASFAVYLLSNAGRPGARPRT
ncbi:MAG: DUF2891 domain-containing protein [Planctomycetes bacterium]|nr:DUF2891 domain-containing protein [Planctomycetota bacterium]